MIVYQFPLSLSVTNFRRHLSSVFFVCFFFVFFVLFCFVLFFLLFFSFFVVLNMVSFGKKFTCSVERLNVKQRRSRRDGSL